MEDADALLARIVDWAGADERVEAVLLTGSRGRGERVDAFSDLDVELIGPRWAELAADSSWQAEFGRVLVSQRFDRDAGADATTRLLVLEHGRKVDVTLAGPERLTGGLDPLLARGYRVLLDKTGSATALPPAPHTAPVPPVPERAEFEAVVGEFWFEASQVPVYLVRGDLWVVKFRDWTMKEALLRVLEWFAATEPAGAPDTWYIGHHLAEWLPPEVYARARECFARYDAADSWRALGASTALFRLVAGTVADRCGFPRPDELADGVTALIEEMAAQSPESSASAGPAGSAGSGAAGLRR